MCRVVVSDHETSKNEEAKSPLPGCENTTAVGCNGRKTNKQTNNILKDLSKFGFGLKKRFRTKIITVSLKLK
jgi:hypothetical protein